MDSFPANSQQQELFFEGFEGTTNVSTNGVAIIKNNSILRLTNDIHKLGHAFYLTLIIFKNSTDSNIFSFSIAFAFAIRSRDPKRGGHDFAFAISPSKKL
ncbi:L-type lectin-domain containing receptor kinase IV.2 [Spatholobus suberectus]|nr:L-type lectin-domain containing receptor kinase IV.2 [Spatholobus suberectus]